MEFKLKNVEKKIQWVYLHDLGLDNDFSHLITEEVIFKNFNWTSSTLKPFILDSSIKIKKVKGQYIY